MTLTELLKSQTVRIAALPKMNGIEFADIESLDGYTVPLIAHDYGAKTPVMWNTVYEKLGLNIRNIMVVGDPTQSKNILESLRADPKYIGGGAGVGFKETIVPFLDRTDPIDLKSVNIIVKENEKLIGYNTDAQGLYLSVADAIRSVNREPQGAHYLIIGAGGVAKEFARELARHKARKIGIINRTVSKAVLIAHELNQQYGNIAYALPEDLTRGAVLNTMDPPFAIINTSDKGSDGKLIDVSALAPSIEANNALSIDVARLLYHWNPNVAIVDIVLPKTGRSITLRHAASAHLENLVDGIPMVVNQAAPAYKRVEAAHPFIHKKTLSEEKILEIMREATR